MRTKVEKRRVRHEHAGNLPSAAAASFPASSVPVLSLQGDASKSFPVVSSVTTDKHCLSWDVSDRRPVSLSEAERLAAANHVVVALGPPVICPSRVVVDIKGDGVIGVAGSCSGGNNGGDTTVEKGAPEVHRHSEHALAEDKKSGSVPIKKPPKKRRNSERKVELAVDHISSPSLYTPGSFPLVTSKPHLMSEASGHSSMFSSEPQQQQQQQQPLVAAIGSLPPLQPQQHSFAPTPPTPSPPHQPLALLHKIPHSQNFSSSPQQDLSSQLSITDSDLPADGTANVSDPHSFISQKVPTIFHSVNLEPGHTTTAEEVMPSRNLQSRTPSSHIEPISNSSGCVDEDGGESSVSTSLLQPPTWLLTPQENTPPVETSYGLEQPLTYDLASSETTNPLPSVAHDGLVTSPSSSAASTKENVETGDKVSSGKISSKTKSSNTEGTEKKKKSMKRKKNIASDKSNSPETTQCLQPVDSQKDDATKVIACEAENTLDIAKSTLKPKKTSRRSLPSQDNESKAQRLAEIEETINFVIANFVYSCEDLSTVDRLTGAAKDAGQVASAIDAAKTSSAEDVQTHSLTAVDTTMSSPSKSSIRKKSVKKSKKKEESFEKVDAQEFTQETNDPDTVEITKPPKKVSKKKKNSGDSLSGEKSKVDKKLSDKELEMAGSEQMKNEEDIAKPPPNKKKKKKSPKKKEESSNGGTKPTLPSEVIPNGHINPTTAEETRKTPKKKKSKPKAKKDTSTASGNETATSVSPEDIGACCRVTHVTESCQTEIEGPPITNAASTKTAPKKSKKRKADAAQENSEVDKRPGVVSEKIAEGEQISMPSPKKKKKKEKDESNNNAPEATKKKKSPSKSKKIKHLQGQEGEGDVKENGLSNSHDENRNSATSNNKSSGSGEGNTEARVEGDNSGSAQNGGTPISSGSGSRSGGSRKYKKQLDIVVCPGCGHKTRGQAALSRHMKKMHEKSVVLPYPCPQETCEYSASKVSLLARHMLTHSVYMCSRCQFMVDTKDKYEEHLQAAHNVKLDCKLCKKCNRYVKCDSVPMEQHLETCQGPVPFTCDVCNKQFKYESSLKVHHQTHFPDLPKLFHCQQCNYQSNYRANLHKHVQNMHIQRPKDIQCLKCDKMFSTEDNMKRHMKVHSQIRPYKCDKCDKAFKSSCALRGHIVSHELVRPYRCNIENCNREFRTPKFLKSHQEEFHRLIPKRYHCTVEGCKFSFFKLSHLKRHEISHTGERNFHCEWPGCGKSFRHSDNLKVHLRQHTDERPVSCSKCAFTCRQKSSLQWHMKKIHGITSVPVSNSENSSMDAASSTSLTPLGELDIATVPVGAEEMVVDVEVVNVIIPAGESGELPVTITELRPVDLYEFHSDNDSSDEAKPGVFKRNKSKMAATAPLPPPPKELLLKNSVLDVLDEANNRVDTTDSKLKAKKKKSVKKSSKTGSQIPTSTQEENEDREDKEAVPDENKNAENKPAPKTASKSKKPASKQKKKKSVAKDAAEVSKKSVEQSNTKEDIKVVEKKDNEPSVKSPSKAKKSPVKKKSPAKKLAKEVSVVKKTPPKPSAPAKGKKSLKTRSSPKKPSSPKGKPAAQATRKTPPRKAANKKEKSVKSPPKKSPPKKVVAKKKTSKKRAPLKKKAATKKSKKKLEKVDEPQKDDQDVTTPQESETKPRELSRSPRRSQVLSAKEQSSRLDEEPSPIRPDSAMESEEENMPQGKGSPYRDFDSQEMEESSPEPQESPSPPASPLPGDLLHQSPKSENEEADQQEGDEPIPLPAELQAEMMDQREEDDSFDEEVINDIPLTPPRAPAPPPPETSDEEEMVPSPPPPTQMPMSTDASNPTPSSVLTDIQQPGSQATEFQQPLSREDFQQPHSREDFQQPHSREEFQQPLSQSREEYQQQHSREEVLQPHSREEYPQQHSREDMHQIHREEIHQQHSMEELQSQGSVPESMSEPVPSVHSDGMRDDVSLPHSVVQYNPTSATPVSEAESTYQYFQGLAQQPDDSLSEPLAGEPSRLQQLEALAEKPHDDRRSTGEIGVKSPTGAPTSVITSLSPTATSSMNLVTDLSSHRRMEILANDRPMDAHLVRDTPSALPRLPEPPFDAYSALNPLSSGAARDNSNLFPAPPSTPSFMRLTESEAMLQRQRMTTPFLPTPQPPERSLSRLPESSLRPPNPSALLRRPATMAGADMFAGTPGVPQAMPRHPFTNSWPGQDARPSHWGQAPTYLQRSTNAPTTPFPFPTKDNYLAGREFMFDPSVRTSVTDRNMFASLSSSQTQRDLTSEPSPFQLDRFDLSTYFGSHPYTGTSGLDYSRTACGTTPKTFDERYRQTAASMSEFRPLPPTTSADMFSGIGVGVNSLNSASFNLDKYAVYGRDPMYHAAQQLSDNTNSAFLTHTTPAQHSVFDRDYPHRSLYPHQNPAYPFIDERQYPAAAKLTGNPATMAQERDFMARPSPGENQMQDPYRCGMLYNVMNRYTFE